MKKTIHKADTRGNADFGWLKSKHSFSFGQYYNPDKTNFGLLRVLNDDIVSGGAGFPTHPHSNMEIVSIPLSGALAHRDSTGTEKVIHTGEVQIMSAGSGLTHSEYNASENEDVNFLQIWVFPKENNISPRYNQKRFSQEERLNKIQTIVSPEDDQALWINQDAWFSLADIEAGKSLTYSLKDDSNGLYVFVIQGEVSIADNKLNRRDAIGVSEMDQVPMIGVSPSKLLFIEIPLS